MTPKEWTIGELRISNRHLLARNEHLRAENARLEAALADTAAQLVEARALLAKLEPITSDELHICHACGDDRSGKGSLIYQSKTFCNDDCFEEWHAAVMDKYNSE